MVIQNRIFLLVTGKELAVDASLMKWATLQHSCSSSLNAEWLSGGEMNE